MESYPTYYPQVMCKDVYSIAHLFIFNLNSQISVYISNLSTIFSTRYYAFFISVYRHFDKFSTNPRCLLRLLYY